MATIKGKWVFNETLLSCTWYDTGFPVDINFTCDGINYTKISGAQYSTTNLNMVLLQYFSGSSDIRTYVWNNDNFSNPLGWQDEAYRTVDFGTTEQTVSDAFLTWIQANAVPEQTEPTITPTTITYNGTELVSLEEGQTTTFSCEGTKAKTDVSILFGSKGSFSYKGNTVEVEKGKTANLLCAGKKFATDVVIAVEKVEEESIVGTWVFNDFSTVEIPPLQRINLSCEGTFIGLDEKGNVTEISLTTIRIRIADANATGATYTYNFGLVGVPTSDANCDSQTRINFEGNESAYSLHTFGSSTRNTAMMAYTEKYGVYTANEITTFTVTNIDQSQENYPLVLSWLKANATKTA